MHIYIDVYIHIFRKCKSLCIFQEVSGAAEEAVELLEYRLFELGVSIAGR